MTIVLVLLVVGCGVWVAVAAGGGQRDPNQTVSGFSRALHALDPARTRGSAGRPPDEAPRSSERD